MNHEHHIRYGHATQLHGSSNTSLYLHRLLTI